MDHPAPDIRRIPRAPYSPAEDQYRLENSRLSNTPGGAIGKYATELARQKIRNESLRAAGELTLAEQNILIDQGRLSPFETSE